MKKLITICAVVGMLLTASADVKGVIEPRLLLHFDGNDGATSTVDSSPQNHTPISFFGDAQLDTADKAEGSASLLLDGSGDYLTIPNSTDWDILANNADDWTIDFWVRQITSGEQYYLNQGTGWAMYYDSGLGFYSPSTGITFYGGAISTDVWHWIAFCKVADEYAMYADGQQVNYKQSSSFGDFASTLYIGNYGFNGHMDELRITHENLFGAIPNANKTDFIYNNNVPEPATVALLTLGGLAMLRRRNRFSANAKSR